MVVKKKKVEVAVQLTPVTIKTMEINILGETPFISGKFSTAAQDKILAKKQGKHGVKHLSLPPEEEAEGRVHRTSKGDVGYPTSAFHLGMIECAPYCANMTKKLVKGSVRVLGDDGSLTEIRHKKNDIEKFMGRVATGAPDIKYRPRYYDWDCTLIIKYNEAQISPEQIINLANLAGFNCGIGENRPSAPRKSGSFGMYKVSTNGK